MRTLILAAALFSTAAHAGEALAIRRLPARQMRVVLSSDSTGGELLAVDGSTPSYMWEVNLCTRQGTGPTAPWVCLLTADDRRFKARGRTGYTVSPNQLEEADVTCIINGGSGCPACQYPTRPAGPPAPPSLLTASCASNSQMPTLSWRSPSAGGNDGILIEVSSDAGNTWQEAARLSPALLSAGVAGAGVNLPAHVNVFYRARALYGANQTAPSNIVSITTGTATAALPGAPTGLTALFVPGCFEGLDCPCQ